ncbi:POK8 protein, partial [Mohoua ochrocephala]|nr:POK8 protein [Mohoua ochrocephala]
VKLRAMALAFSLFTGPVNIVTDSAYAPNLVFCLDKAIASHVSNQVLSEVLLNLWNFIQSHMEPYFILHLRSHTNLPGFFVEGNAVADGLVSAVALGPIPNLKEQAVLSHQFFHQGHKALRQQFQLSHAEARSILASCPDCQGNYVPSFYGTNP